MIFISLLCVIGLILVLSSWLRADMKCPPPKIIYRYVPMNPLDLQFSEINKASDIFNGMSDNPWIGGYTIEKGKTIVSNP
jgi:hypothetical protein